MLVNPITQIADEHNTFTLDFNTRTFTTNNNYIIAVQGDNNSQLITFKIPRTYDGVDLSTINCAFKYWTDWTDDSEWELHSEGVLELTPIKIEDDYIYYNWLLNTNQTGKEGTCYFGFKFYVKEEEEITYLLSTREGSFKIESGALSGKTNFPISGTTEYYQTEIDQTYNPTSIKPQSGVALSKAFYTKVEVETKAEELAEFLLDGMVSENLLNEELSKKADLSNKVTNIDENSTDEQYPSAKAVYTELQKKQNTLSESDFKTINGESILGEGDIKIQGGNAEIPENVETTDNKVTSINLESTDEQYPSAKAVHTELQKKQDTLSSADFKTINGTSVFGSGDIVITGGEGGGSIVVDTEFDKNSSNPQSGKAVAGVLRDVVGEEVSIELIADPTISEVTVSGSTQAITINNVQENETYIVTGRYGYATVLIAAYNANNTLVEKVGFAENNAGPTTEVCTFEYKIPKGVTYLKCTSRMAVSPDAPLYPSISRINSRFNAVSELIEESHIPMNSSIQNLQEEVNYIEQTKKEQPKEENQSSRDEKKGLNSTAIDLLVQILENATYDNPDMLDKVAMLKKALAVEDVVATLVMPNDLTPGTYNLKYENNEGYLSDCANICSFTVTDNTPIPNYDKFIEFNKAPENATTIGIYNSSNEKVGDIVLGSLKHDVAFGEKLYSFGAISDVHIGQADSIEDFTNASTYFESEEDIEFVTICGDMVDDSSITAQLEKYHEIVRDKTKPIYVTAGNHEALRYKDGENFDDIKQYFAQTNHPNINQDLYYSFTYGDDVYIMLGQYGSPNYQMQFSDEELQWLYTTLEENRNKRCFLFVHYFPWDGSGDAIKKYEDEDCLKGVRGDVLYSLLKHYKNVIYFHGHSHAAFQTQEANSMNIIDTFHGKYSVHIPSLTWPRQLNADGQFDKNSSAGEGYVVDVYEKGIVLKGRDFEKNKFVPIGTYCLDTTIEEIEPNTYYDSNGIIKNQNTNVLKIENQWYCSTTVDKSDITKISFVTDHLGLYDEEWNPTDSEDSPIRVYRKGTELFIDDKGLGVRAIDIFDPLNYTPIGKFSGFTSLVEIKDLWKLDVSDTTDMRNMFFNCTKLQKVFLNSFYNAKPYAISGMFSGCSSLINIDMSSMNLYNVYHFDNLCYGCSSLQSIIFPYQKNNPSAAQRYCSNMFNNCSSLKSVDLTFLSKFEGVTRFNELFCGCSSLKTVVFGEVNIADVLSKFIMGCSSLEVLDISGFDISQADNLYAFAADCTSLTTIILPEVFDTSKVTKMDYAFANCPNLTLDCSSWSTTSNPTMVDFNKNSPKVIAPEKNHKYIK